VFPQRPGETLSEDVAAEIRSRTGGTRDSGDDFLTAATRAVAHGVRTLAAEFADPVEGARAIIAGVLRGAGENEDMTLKTLSQMAHVVVREAVLLGYGPTAWIEGVLSGAVAAAGALGLDRDNALSAAAQGILQGAEEAGVEPARATAATVERTIRSLDNTSPRSEDR
jgi:hypothetical protein